ncbi:hypothetical protein BS47DRAFT_111375 [Hydnum rufescens UP504]|uniref:Uncharacterized protein n=1 Tax=Hydnum rufescens UP504 TaxID=1448309 RepID=A0A9P6ASE6_9AGAM|nr:hypothetical protein BS47DRAFT_111375 [Hydnum rufescens UP504]
MTLLAPIPLALPLRSTTMKSNEMAPKPLSEPRVMDVIPICVVSQKSRDYPPADEITPFSFPASASGHFGSPEVFFKSRFPNLGRCDNNSCMFRDVLFFLCSYCRLGTMMLILGSLRVS